MSLHRPAEAVTFLLPPLDKSVLEHLLRGSTVGTSDKVCVSFPGGYVSQEVLQQACVGKKGLHQNLMGCLPRKLGIY